MAGGYRILGRMVSAQDIKLNDTSVTMQKGAKLTGITLVSGMNYHLQGFCYFKFGFLFLDN